MNDSEYRQYAICLSNEGYPASLEKGKVYPVLDPLADDPPDYLRVVDESGEDYLFASDRFHVITLPGSVDAALRETEAA